jgi:hypothetical protein
VLNQTQREAASDAMIRAIPELPAWSGGRMLRKLRLAD